MLHGRSSGVLLHATSLPGNDGVGDFGPAAYAWVDTVRAMGCTYWQVLPLGPTGYGDSPYQCFSSFAGNPSLISLDLLVEGGLLDEPEDRPLLDPHRVDYGRMIQWKTALLDRAYETFCRTRRSDLTKEFDEFIETEQAWLDDYSLFMVIKARGGGGSFTAWAPELRDRVPTALDRLRREAAEELRRVAFGQFLFSRQWKALRQYATSRDVRIIGDLPIFVASDSADVWANRELFEVDATGQPTLVSGVPPDYFSPTGQLWGNPQYRWDIHRAQDYRWWMQRLAATLTLVDLVRIDHFRAFADYWEIQAGNPTAENGRWLKGPGEAFFHVVSEHFPEMPIIAEDLGEISPIVFELRDQFELPGMKILQFAFDGDDLNPFLPEHYPENCVVYTGTHDNDTTVGWWTTADEANRHQARTYLGVDGSDIAWDLIRTAWKSRAALSVAPLQDILGLDGAHRMNTPGQPAGNWTWRMTPRDLTDEVVERMRSLNDETGR